MARVNIFLKDEILRAVDEAAAQAGHRRSRFVQEALRRRLEDLRRECEEAERRARMEAACRTMDDLAEKLGDWDAVSIIRRFRDSRYGPASGGAIASRRPRQGRADHRDARPEPVGGRSSTRRRARP